MQLPSRLGVRHLAAEIGSRPATFLEGEVTTAGRKPLTPPVRTCLSRLRRLMCGDSSRVLLTSNGTWMSEKARNVVSSLPASRLYNCLRTTSGGA